MTAPWPGHNQTIAGPIAAQWPQDGSPSPSPKEDTKKEKAWNPDLEAFRIRICSWFKRRPETRWKDKEIKLLKEAFESGFTSEELDILEQFYLGSSKYKRRDIITLLNNWNTEIDRAKGEAGLFGAKIGKPEIDPTDAKDFRNYL